MRAPVYRSLDATSTVLGLAMPYEAGAVGLVLLFGIAWAPPGPTVLLTLATYLALRLAGRGHPPGYVQDLLPFQLRRLGTNGRFSAAARTRGQPRFPWAPYLSRDPVRTAPPEPERPALTSTSTKTQTQTQTRT